MRMLANIVGFYAGWFACVLGAADGMPWLGPVVAAPLLALHLALHPARRRELGFLVLAAAAGVAVDSGMLLVGVLRFEGSHAVTPMFLLWFGALWATFATTATVCLRWLARWPLLAAALGAVGGPATYYLGAELGAIGLHEELGVSLVALGVEWAIMMPALLWFAGHWHRTAPIEARAGVVRP